MEAKIINKFPIREYLAGMNIHPAINKTYYGMYHSPFREDKTASMRVNYDKNLWYDFGSNEGGALIDLVMLIENCTNGKAMQILERIIQGSVSFSFHGNGIGKAQTALKPRATMQISRVAPISNHALVNYLAERRISADVARKYCRQIDYKVGDRSYFALAFKNDKGGYEIRNPYYKACTSKALTTIAQSETKRVFVFEGFFDFLSFLEIGRRGGKEASDFIGQSDFIVINSVALVNPLLSALKPYSDIRLMLDNDNAGVKAREQIQAVYPSAMDCSKSYSRHKDLNQFLVNSGSKELAEFISRCVIVRTETKVSSLNDNLAFTPEGRKSGAINRLEQPSAKVKIQTKKRRGLCR